MANIGVQVVVDPSGAVSGGRVATTSLDQIEKAADGATGTISRLEKELAVLAVKQRDGAKAAAVFASTQSLSGKATDVQRVQIEQLTGEVYDLQVATANASKRMDTFGRSSMNVSNIGYQIQDSMVQAQMGTSGFVIAAQQLPQALIGFGAVGSVVGTAVAVISVGLMALNPNLADSTTATDKLTDTMKSLNAVIDTTSFGVLGLSDDMLELYGTSEQLAKVQLSLAFSKATLAIEQASNAALEATEDFGTFFTDLSAGAVNLEELDKRTTALFGGLASSIDDIKNAGTFVGQGQIVSSVELLSDKFKIAEGDAISLLRSYQALTNEKSPENIKALSDVVSEITLNTPEATLAFRQFAADIGEVSQKADSASDILRFVLGAMTDLGKTVQVQSSYTQEYNDDILSLSQNLVVLQTRIAGNNREAAIQEAVFRSGAEAGSEYAAQVALLAGQQYDLQQQLSTTNDTLKEYDQDGQYIASLERQVGLIGESAREQAMLRAEYSLSEEATATQIEQARQLAGALYDASEAKKEQTRQEREAKRESEQATEFSMGIVGDATGLEALEQKRQIVLQYQEQEIGDAQAHAAALESLERQSLAERASITSSGLGSILSLQQAYGDDSSGIYRTLLTIQKTATLYSVLLSSQESIGKAWASAPFPANLPAVATATVETGALAATVQALTPSFATGGLAYGPGTGTSDSFTANLSNGEFVMPQRETMRNLGTLQAMRAGVDVGGRSAPNLQIINQTTGKIDSASVEWVDQDTVRAIIREDVPGILAAEVNDEYSQFNRANQNQYVTQRKF